MAKTRWLLIAVLVLAVVAGGLWWRSAHSETALEGLQDVLNKSTELWAFKQVIGVANIGAGDQLIIYETPAGNTVTARMKRESHFLSVDWKMLGALHSGSVKQNPDSTTPFAMSGQGYKDMTIVNGVVYRDQIVSLKAGDKEVPFVEKPGLVRVYYLLLPADFYKERSNPPLMLTGYDKDGNVVEEMPL